ncbi:MAG: V-type ATP synthase subunit E [candidate division WOR-3 bacterium]|nr:V-type ATP synthase subunit E [candidate division WOR-3 bacterium]MCX7757414.1 V-type ATP synthase subunit E [candidate division WOR-3 bacterium]MDW7988147.1 V-type ATP synthase subunit E [candidate division WOR-3 bacterium]
MAVEKLTAVIIESAKKKAEEIRLRTDEIISAKRKKIENEIQNRITEHDIQITQKIAQLKKQILADQELKNQQALLQAKWDIISEIFSEAYQQFINSHSYYQIIQDLIKKFVDSQSIVIVNEKDYAVLKPLFPNVQMKVSQTLTGGVIIEKGHITMNYSLDLIMSRLKKLYLADIGKILFSK